MYSGAKSEPGPDSAPAKSLSFSLTLYRYSRNLASALLYYYFVVISIAWLPANDAFPGNDWNPGCCSRRFPPLSFRPYRPGENYFPPKRHTHTTPSGYRCTRATLVFPRHTANASRRFNSANTWTIGQDNRPTDTFLRNRFAGMWSGSTARRYFRPSHQRCRSQGRSEERPRKRRLPSWRRMNRGAGAEARQRASYIRLERDRRSPVSAFLINYHTRLPRSICVSHTLLESTEWRRCRCRKNL